MTLVKDMLDATAQGGALDVARAAELLEALQDAERASTSCAAAMVGAGHGMAEAVQADLDLADVCQATGRVLARAALGGEDITGPLLAVCSAAARRSNDQCSRHAHHHAHCRLCAEASQRLVDLVG